MLDDESKGFRGIIPGGDGVLIVAEIGTAHGGELERGYELIDAAVDAGANCVKFQVVFADEIIHPLTGIVELPGGGVSLYERFKSLEREIDFFGSLKKYAEKRNVLFLASSFGVKSARLLKELDVSAIKIASPELNHYPMLEEIADYGIWKIISTGVSRLCDIERALDVLGYERSVILHCITSYPAPVDEYNLLLLKSLKAIFGLPVGVSDHSLDPIVVPALSVVMGGVVVEKHFTFSREGEGLDDRIALTPKDFGRMVEIIRAAFREPASVEKMLRKEYGEKRIDSILGDGVKRLAPSERGNYLSTNRTIHALRDIRKDEILTEENVAVLRSEKNLKPGLDPRFFKLILGKRVVRDIESGRGIEWNDLLLD